jgi:hypothetical protein
MRCSWLLCFSRIHDLQIPRFQDLLDASRNVHVLTQHFLQHTESGGTPQSTSLLVTPTQSTEGKLFLTSRRSYTPLILRFLRPPPSQKHNALLPMPPNPLSHLFFHLLPRISSLLFSHLDRYFTLAPLPHAPTPLCHLGNIYSQLSFRRSSLSLPSSIASLTNTPMFGRPSLSRSSPVLALANV